MNLMILAMLSMMATLTTPNEKALNDAVQTAKDFVKHVDDSDAKKLAKVLHPEMMQFSMLGDKLLPSKGTDFVKMIADKKLGGTPRTVTLKSVQSIRGETVDVILQAVSSEYDFMYQISLAKTDGKWLVVTVLSDIKPAKK